jgi:hypothetical protein
MLSNESSNTMVPLATATPATGGCESVRWSTAEISHVVAAVNRVGDPSRHGEVAEILGDRTAAQLTANIAHLARAGRLARPAP